MNRNPKWRVFGSYAILGVWREAVKTRFSQFVSCSMYNLPNIFKDNTEMLRIISRQFYSKFGSKYDFTLTCLKSAWILVTTIKLDLQCSTRFLTNVKSYISIQVLIKRHELEICYRRIERECLGLPAGVTITLCSCCKYKFRENITDFW